MKDLKKALGSGLASVRLTLAALKNRFITEEDLNILDPETGEEALRKHLDGNPGSMKS